MSKGSLETGSDRLAWSSPGPYSSQTFIADTRKLLGTVSPNHSIGLGPQAAGRGLGDHRGGGKLGMKKRASRQVGGGSHLLRGSASKVSPNPSTLSDTLRIKSQRQAECCVVITGTEWQESRQPCLGQDVPASSKI